MLKGGIAPCADLSWNFHVQFNCSGVFMSVSNHDPIRWRPYRGWVYYSKMFTAVLAAGYAINWFVEKL